MYKKLKSTGVILALLVVLSACGAEAAPVEEAMVEVPIALGTMKKDVIEHTYISVGEIVPESQVDLFVGGGGFIEDIMVGTGDIIEEGMVLIRLDGSEIDMTNFNATESQLRTVRDNLASQLASLRENFARQEVLYEEGIITKLELDAAANQIENLERELSNAKSAYRNQLTILKDGLEDASDARIIESPVTGMVAALYVKEGQSATGQLGLSIIDDSKLYVKTSVSGDLKKSIALGDSLRIRMDGEEEATHKGIIHEIKKLPDPATRLFEVLIEVEKKEGWIIGDYAEVEFIIERYEAVMVPMAAVVRSGSEQYIYTYKDAELEKTAIDPGRTSGEWLELKNTDQLLQVVIKGQSQLTANSQFVVIE